MNVIAYLDPGTGSLIMQAVLGGAAGVAVLFKSKGRRLFKKGQSEETPTDAVEPGTDEPVPTTPSD